MSDKEVWITTANGARLKGRVVSVTATGLTWSREPSKPVTFGQIVKVELVSHRVRNGVLIGLGVGAGLQVLLTVASVYPDESCLMPTFMCTGGVALIGVGAGTAAGIALNANRGDQDVIYDAKRRTISTRVEPVVSPTRKSLAVTISWR